MLNKKCSNCNSKLDKNFEFCPFCGAPRENVSENYGLLGKNDNTMDLQKTPINMNNSFLDKIMNAALNNAMKIIDQEIKRETQTKNKDPINSNFQLYINGKKIPLQQERTIQKKEDKEIVQTKEVSQETIERSYNLPRKQAETKLVRLKDKVMYEIEAPGLKSLQDVLINKLENSFEVKIYTDKAVLIKTLPIKLKLQQYSISKDKLTLEFKTS